MRLRGKVALLTGAAAHLFVREGAKVVLTDFALLASALGSISDEPLDVANVWNQAGSRRATDFMSFDPSKQRSRLRPC